MGAMKEFLFEVTQREFGEITDYTLGQAMPIAQEELRALLWSLQGVETPTIRAFRIEWTGLAWSQVSTRGRCWL